MDGGVAYYRDGDVPRALGVLAPRDCGRIERRSPRVGLQPLVFRMVIRIRGSSSSARSGVRVRGSAVLFRHRQRWADPGGRSHGVQRRAPGCPEQCWSAVQVPLKAPGLVLVLGVDGDGIVAIRAEPLVRLAGAFRQSFSFCDRNGTNSRALETPFCEAADPLSDTCSTRCGEPASPTAPHAMRAPPREYGLPTA